MDLPILPETYWNPYTKELCVDSILSTVRIIYKYDIILLKSNYLGCNFTKMDSWRIKRSNWKILVYFRIIFHFIYS